MKYSVAIHASSRTATSCHLLFKHSTPLCLGMPNQTTLPPTQHHISPFKSHSVLSLYQQSCCQTCKDPSDIEAESRCPRPLAISILTSTQLSTMAEPPEFISSKRVVRLLKSRSRSNSKTLLYIPTQLFLAAESHHDASCNCANKVTD